MVVLTELRSDKRGDAMARGKSSNEIKVDALRVAVEKLHSGCVSCADGYLSIARKHGASEEEITSYLRNATKQNYGALSRKTFIQRSAGVAAGLAAVEAFGGFVRDAPAETAAAQTTGLTSAVWALGMSPVADRLLFGMDAVGKVVGQLDVTNKLVLQSRDRQLMYFVSSARSGVRATAFVEAIFTDSGRAAQSFHGETVDLGGPTGQHAVWPALSADGRYLAVFHQVTRVVAQGTIPVRRTALDGTTTTVYMDKTVLDEAIEIFDTQSGRSISAQTVSSKPGRMCGAQVVFALGDHLIMIFKQDDDPDEPAPKSTVVLLSFDGARLSSPRQASQGTGDAAMPALLQILDAPMTLLNDGATVVRMSNGETLHWFSALHPGISGDLNVRPPRGLASKGYPTTTLYTTATAFIVNSYLGYVQAVDLNGRRRLHDTYVVPDHAPDTRPLGGYPGPQSAALSSDANSLYLVDSIAGGIAVLDTSTFEVRSRSLEGTFLRAVRLADDGAGLFASALDGSVIFILSSEGVVVGAVRNTPHVAEFLSRENSLF